MEDKVYEVSVIIYNPISSPKHDVDIISEKRLRKFPSGEKIKTGPMQGGGVIFKTPLYAFSLIMRPQLFPFLDSFDFYILFCICLRNHT